MRRLRLVAPFAVMLLIAAACTSDEGGGDEPSASGSPAGEDTGNVNILSAVEPEEAEAVQEVLDAEVNPDVEYQAEIEASGNFEEQLQIRAEGGTLDIALLPQPGSVPAQAAAGTAIALEDLGFDIDELTATFGESFMALGEYEGKHYGLPTNINLKSMVWYPKDDFDAAGYEVPTTWDELMALSDQIAADGSTPWCVGFKSEGSSGWPATDWVEDIVLRTAGPDVYEQWWKHEIPFNDPQIVAAVEQFGDVMFREGYVLGGPENTPSVEFGDAPGPMFENPPKCWLHRQASFINAFFPADAESGVDYDWFPLPPIDQEGTLYAGEMAIVGRDAPEVRDFLNRFIGVDVQCGMGGITAASRISPNVKVGPECYANDILAEASEILSTASTSGTGGFDASDLMPPEVGQGSFWTGMLQYMQEGPDSLQSIMDEIEASWPAQE
ncbi:MAG TPA: ABC transporter substrate-binding protein [Actinomycetota bacterium]|nr:ABC transporter substrate-binding protein [Actinomycetota bacterium]